MLNVLLVDVAGLVVGELTVVDVKVDLLEVDATVLDV